MDSDFSEIKTLLSEDVYIVIYNRERKNGIDAVLDYFKDWQQGSETRLNVK